MMHFSENQLFNAQIERSIGCTSYQGAEIGECLAIVTALIPGDKESWYHNWFSFGQKNEVLGDSLMQKNLILDAKMAFLRASTYYRTAFFFLEDKPSDKRIEEALERSIHSFHRAITCFETPVEIVEIPFEGLNLPGYLYLSPNKSKDPKPLLIDTGGGDGTKEELYFGSAAEALSRGIHCLTFEGPGQGSVLRLKKIPFIPDWERVIQKVVDYVQERPEVDPNKIILLGRSFGGYLATRAVTKEKRIAAAIVDPGILNPIGNFDELFQKVATKEPGLKNAPLNAIMDYINKNDEKMRFMLASRFWRFGAKSIEEMVSYTKPYTLEGLVEQIQCPMLVCDNNLEYITLGQAKKLYDKLDCPKKYVLFSDKEGAGGHCEPVSPRLFSAKVYEWLAKINLVQPG